MLSAGPSPYGSSPHTRGTPISVECWPKSVRFIPAYAGNAINTAGVPQKGPVHPRIRGERLYCARAAAIRDGSSPHTRGTPLGSHCWRSNPRFIPAYAGNAKSLAPHSSPHSVHPRIRGERGAGLSGRGGRCGSSPHTRGTQDGRLSSLMENRFIPAYAGNARCLCSQRTPAPVHPRIRGERRVRRPAADLCGGSSPHTRGTPRPRTRCTMAFRFIPAYAGNARSTPFCL